MKGMTETLEWVELSGELAESWRELIQKLAEEERISLDIYQVQVFNDAHYALLRLMELIERREWHIKLRISTEREAEGQGDDEPGRPRRIYFLFYPKSSFLD